LAGRGGKRRKKKRKNPNTIVFNDRKDSHGKSNRERWEKKKREECAVFSTTLKEKGEENFFSFLLRPGRQRGGEEIPGKGGGQRG